MALKKYSSIEEYKQPLFRNDIIAILIEFELFSLNKELKSTLRFRREDENSDLFISLVDENPREKVTGLSNGITSLFTLNKNLNWLFYPNSLLSICIFFVSIYFGIQATEQAFSSKEKFLFGTTFWAGMFYLFIIPSYFKGYSSFETNKQKQIDKWFGWLLTGLLGFLLFATLLISI